MSLADLNAVDAAAQLAEGQVSSVDMVTACLDRIGKTEETVQAWVHLDPEHALAQAKALDEARESGMVGGPLFGLPVGVKDIFDTSDMPTENGTAAHAGRAPNHDATVVALLRQAGAVVMGKTVTTECACYEPSKTRNPHDPARTPGGSSSGSAAAVAAKMVPLAIGSQTNGSMIRPASFCGVVGYKPTHGRISRSGVLALSHVLDTVGVFGRTVADAALIADALNDYDANDPDMRPRAKMRLSEAAASEPPLPPIFAFVKTPFWDRLDDDSKTAYGELKEALGDECDEVDLPDPFAEVTDLHRLIMVADIAQNISPLLERGDELLSESMRDMIAEGREVKAIDYNRAVQWIDVLNAGLDQIFDRYDAIITPAARGEAPVGLESTGDPIFCTTWTYCGVPAISLPLMEGEHGAPIGVQVVGQKGHDGRLLRNANWLMKTLTQDGEAA